MGQMNILIGDDHALISNGVIAYFQTVDNDAEFVTAINKNELFTALELKTFDVLILDVRFGEDDAREIIGKVIKIAPDMKRIALSSHEDELTVKSVLASGFQAYVSKSAPLSELIDAVAAVSNGKQYVSSQLEKKLFASLFTKDSFANEINLTNREKEVLEQIQAGLSSKEIAAKLFISEKTVETYRSALLMKFQVKNVASLVRESILKGFIF
jgi:DNA-binding NarL/FixJ family response regulator